MDMKRHGRGVDIAHLSKIGCRAAAVFIAVNIASSLLFITMSDEPVFDDVNNLPDVLRYDQEGISVNTLRRHINPTGPGSFIWMAKVGRWLGGELWSYRLAITLSWILMATFVFLFEKTAATDGLAYWGLLATAAVPHAAIATATLLTEGPALLFAFVGSMVWLNYVSKPQINSGTGFGMFLGGALVGLAVFSRQYYLMLLPTMACYSFVVAIRNKGELSIRWWISVFISGAIAVIPVAFLLWLWGGLSSPGMVTGQSYENWKSSVGFDPTRPLTALFYMLVYLVPVTFPVIFRLDSHRRIHAVVVGFAGAAVICVYGRMLLQWGPIRSAVILADNKSYVPDLLLALIGFIISINLMCLAIYLKDVRPHRRNAYVEFSALALLFFALEQVGVGGNIPFYERYVLQVTPYLGIIGIGLVPEYLKSRVAVAAILSVIGNAMLWRYL
jgi:hypothetical protein